VRKLLPVAIFLVLSGSLAGSLGAAALIATSPPSFVRARSYAAGRVPGSVAIGDLNADAKPDLAAANSDDNTVSVLFNLGDGSFLAKRDYPTGSQPSEVAVGDLNGDGSPDLATANSLASTVSVFLNSGDGSFQARLDYASGIRPWSVAIGDLNDDGKPDLATANFSASTVSVFLNRGNGSFQAKRDYATGRNPASVAIGDLNGDGKPDLATANQQVGHSTVSVLANKGDGSFQPKHDYRHGGDPWSIAIGDLNADGKPDLVTANVGTDTVSVLANRGDGSFRAKRDYRTGVSPVSVAIGDLNGDGKPDVATANGGGGVNTVSVLLNRGDGIFHARFGYATGHQPASVAIGDLNADRKPDLATADQDGDTVSVLLYTPGVCRVPNLKGKTLPVAKRTIARAQCRVGRLRRAYSTTVKRGRVVLQKPKPGTLLPKLGLKKINLVVSRGRRPS
jgi:hypothetical protein